MCLNVSKTTEEPKSQNEKYKPSKKFLEEYRVFREAYKKCDGIKNVKKCVFDSDSYGCSWNEGKCTALCTIHKTLRVAKDISSNKCHSVMEYGKSRDCGGYTSTEPNAEFFVGDFIDCDFADKGLGVSIEAGRLRLLDFNKVAMDIYIEREAKCKDLQIETCLDPENSCGLVSKDEGLKCSGVCVMDKASEITPCFSPDGVTAKKSVRVVVTDTDRDCKEFINRLKDTDGKLYADHDLPCNKEEKAAAIKEYKNCPSNSESECLSEKTNCGYKDQKCSGECVTKALSIGKCQKIDEEFIRRVEILITGLNDCYEFESYKIRNDGIKFARVDLPCSA